MADVVDKATRSRMMSGIRGKNTKPEIRVRQYLHRMGLRFRLHVKDLPGKPDICFPKFRTTVFVNGCFWHRHLGCRYANTPATRIDFWDKKFAQNIKRDQENFAALEELGWKAIVVWECEVRTGDARLQELFRQITGGSN